MRKFIAPVSVLLLVTGVCLAACFWTAVAYGQEIVKEALGSFPPQTVRLEFSDPAQLRGLPSYRSLRTRYVSQSLKQLEDDLGKLGVAESDIDELVLGWQSSGGSFVLNGLAAGRFSSTEIDRFAKAGGVGQLNLADSPVYCFGSDSESPCVAILENGLGAFGPLPVLRSMLEARRGNGVSLGTNGTFAALVDQAKSDKSIWGVATGQTTTDWFKAWIPAQKDFPFDWARAFQDVQSLVYSVDARDAVKLDLRLNCANSDAASKLRQLLDGVKAFQQLAWQRQNPGQPNPFQDLDVDSSSSQVTLGLTTSYTILENAAPSGGQ